MKKAPDIQTETMLLLQRGGKLKQEARKLDAEFNVRCTTGEPLTSAEVREWGMRFSESGRKLGEIADGLIKLGELRRIEWEGGGRQPFTPGVDG